MGLLHTFRCPACRYAAEVSGGPDAGMQVATQTVACLDCRALFDVPTDRYGRGAPEAVALACPVDAAHRVEAWGEPFACPRCGAAPMVAEEPSVSWD